MDNIPFFDGVHVTSGAGGDLVSPAATGHEEQVLDPRGKNLCKTFSKPSKCHKPKQKS